MTLRPRPRASVVVRASALLAALLVAGAIGVQAQTPPELSFIRALGEYHDLPAAEVRVLAEWRIPIAEMPVALAVAERAGISPDVLVASRRNGRSWPGLAARYGLDVTSFHVELTSPPPALAGLYTELDELPRARWGEATLSDTHLIYLANVRFLRDYVGVSPDDAAAAIARYDSPAAALRALGT